MIAFSILQSLKRVYYRIHLFQIPYQVQLDPLGGLDYTSLTADTNHQLIVDGSFSCWGLSVQETLRVNGEMYVGGYVNFSYDMVEVTGTDKIQYAQVYTKIDWPKRIDIGEEAGKVTGVDEFISTLVEAEANGDPHIQYRIELVLYTDAVIDNSITVPENCNLSIQATRT